MASFDSPDLPDRFREVLKECRELYVCSGRLIVDEHPDWLPQSNQHFVELMDDLHRALLVKVFVSICESDRRWSTNEQFLAQALVIHLWGRRLRGRS